MKMKKFYDLFIFIGVTLGFDESNIQVPENITGGVRLICIGIRNGILGRMTIVNISFQDGTATSEYKQNLALNLHYLVSVDQPLSVINQTIDNVLHIHLRSI